MSANTLERVIVDVGPCECHTVTTTHIHHRDFPELNSEGESVTDAGAQLKNALVRERDNAASGFHRSAIERAIADVEAFLRSQT
jgi:hypothetical protein